MGDGQLDSTKRLIEALDTMLDVAHKATFDLAYRTRSGILMKIAAKIPSGERLVHHDN